MPKLQVPGARLHYEDTGGPHEPIVFAHGLLWSGSLYEPQVAFLRRRYRCITFDFRGQGQSEVAETGHDMDTLTRDAIALIESLHVGPCHFVGLSMGGFVGMRLAARRPDLIRTLALLSTSADGELLKNALRLRGLAFVTRWLSLRLVGWRAMSLMFGSKFRTDPARAEEWQHWKRRLLANHRIGISRAIRGVYQRQPVDEELDRIKAPTLILVGGEDTLTPLHRARRVEERIPGSRLVIIPDAGHTLTIEDPSAVNVALAEFMAAHPIESASWQMQASERNLSMPR